MLISLKTQYRSIKMSLLRTSNRNNTYYRLIIITCSFHNMDENNNKKRIRYGDCWLLGDNISNDISPTNELQLLLGIIIKKKGDVDKLRILTIARNSIDAEYQETILKEIVAR
jgi:hypothetical protein